MTVSERLAYNKEKINKVFIEIDKPEEPEHISNINLE